MADRMINEANRYLFEEPEGIDEISIYFKNLDENGQKQIMDAIVGSEEEDEEEIEAKGEEEFTEPEGEESPEEEEGVGEIGAESTYIQNANKYLYEAEPVENVKVQIFYANLDEDTQALVLDALTKAYNISDQDDFGMDKVEQALAKLPIFKTNSEELIRQLNIDGATNDEINQAIDTVPLFTATGDDLANIIKADL